jgi:predicted ATPase
LASTEQKGPVFIDEPELSLHPDWQLKFNDFVVELVKHSRRQVFFASHSPEIVMQLMSRAFPVEQIEGEQ